MQTYILKTDERCMQFDSTVLHKHSAFSIRIIPGNDLWKLCIVDATVAILVSLLYHGICFLFRHALSHGCYYMTQFRSCDKAVAIAVNDSKKKQNMGEINYMKFVAANWLIK